jgi:hypothetical protein
LSPVRSIWPTYYVALPFVASDDGRFGAPAPKSVAIVEWDNLGDAVAVYKSKAWADLAPERDKVIKVIRRYAVEVEK